MALQPLHFSPDAPAWVVAAAWPVLMVHIAAGLTGIVAGYTAILARKGAPMHRMAGTVFFIAMIGMLSTGGLIAAAESNNRGTGVGALFGIYLVTTAWSAARTRDGPAGGIERTGFWFAMIVGLTMVALSLFGFSQPHAPQPQTGAALVIGVIALLAAAADRKTIRQGMVGVDRILRHLWRMGAAMFFATGSFFLGQQKVMPQAIQGSPILIVLAVAPLLLMIFWLVYVRISPKFGGRRPAAEAPPARAGRLNSTLGDFA